MRRCALDDTGRNSVKPCTSPRRIASPSPMASVTSGHDSRGALPQRTWPRRLVLRLMEQRHLGRTGLRVSRLGLGTMTWSRDTDEHDATEQLRDFTDAGGTLVDTSASYADGGAEELLGELLGRRGPARRGRPVHQGRHPAHQQRRRGGRLARRPAGVAGRLPAPPADRPRRPVARPDARPAHPARRDRLRAAARRHQRARPLRRAVQPRRLAGGPRGEPARAARSGSPRSRPSTRCCSAGSSARWCPRPSRSASACSRGRRWGAAS